MKREWLALSRRYQDALQNHAKQAISLRLRSAQLLGQQAVTLGLATLDLARIHKMALAALMLPTDSLAA
ncbi:MAG TPA: hypothetical protein VK530_12930, partial [Candidatus Acidoferrum sp.]|nr:hypothetical protein [Candidatus Acidoferrum sp.]